MKKLILGVERLAETIIKFSILVCQDDSKSIGEFENESYF